MESEIMPHDLGKAVHESWHGVDLMFIHYRLAAISDYKNHRKVTVVVSLDGNLLNATFKTKLSVRKVEKNSSQEKPLELKFGKFVAGDDGEEYMLFDGGFKDEINA